MASEPLPKGEEVCDRSGSFAELDRSSRLAAGAVPDQLDEAEWSRHWSVWLLRRNRRGTRVLLWIGITLYPLFGVLDYVVAPRAWLWILLATRAAVAVLTLVMFRLLRSPLFERHPNFLSAGYLVTGSFGISLMTVFLGGVGSPYYAGLSLTIVASGLLFVWPAHVVLLTHSLIVTSFVVPNVLGTPGALQFLNSISNLFFLISTAIIISAGQMLSYRAQRAEIANQLLLERTKSHLEAVHRELRALDKHKSEFFANITHELKTPLSMILVPLELMLEGPEASRFQEHRPTLQTMYRNSLKMLKLVGDLLDLSKLEESRLRLNVAELDLVQYLRDLSSQVLPLARRKAIEVRFQADMETAKVWCDVERIERVVINLLSNALKFTPIHGTVDLSMREEPDWVEITVRDDGIGFPEEMAERVFERFFQVDSSDTRKFGGTGIGLALARELVELHGGTIRAKSRPNEGATFTVRMRKGREHFRPEVLERRVRASDRLGGQRAGDRGLGDWHKEAAPQFRLLDIDEVTEQRMIEREVEDESRTYTALVVEDTPDVIRIIHLALRHYCRVIAAADGRRGFELAKAHRPNVIISDLMMPEINGFELTRMLRSEPQTKQIPIVMLTARGDLDDRVRGIDTGVNAYLTKPFAPKELVSTVRALLQQQENAADVVLTARMDSLETIAGGLAHEINNPLNYIKGALTAIEHDCRRIVAIARAASRDTGPSSEPEPSSGPVSRSALDTLQPRIEKMLMTARQGVRRIGTTVDLMRRYSREGYSRVSQPYNLAQGVRDVIDMVVPAVGRNVAVETALLCEGTVHCVPEELNQVLSNLIQNAVEAVPEGTGRVVVSLREDGGDLCLSVMDNGRGIPPEHRAKVFTPFFTTKEVGAGMGLGLTITRRVVASLGGTIRVNCPVGGGTEFVVRLPMGPGVAVEAAEAG